MATGHPPEPGQGMQPAAFTPPDTQKRQTTGLVLVVLGGALCVLSTVVIWTIDFTLGVDTEGPTVHLGYWTGFTLANLAAAPTIDCWTWTSDLVVTLLTVVVVLWATVALTGHRPPPWWLTAGVGVAGLVVFGIESVVFLAEGLLVLALNVSLLGAGLLVLGGALCWEGVGGTT